MHTFTFSVRHNSIDSFYTRQDARHQVHRCFKLLRYRSGTVPFASPNASQRPDWPVTFFYPQKNQISSEDLVIALNTIWLIEHNNRHSRLKNS